MARPRKEIEREEFEKLCGFQCTKLEICDWFDITDKTLESWCKRTYKKGFSEVFALKRGKGKVSLRRNAFNMAEKNAAVLIFLLKNFCDMSDKPEKIVEEEKTDDGFIEALEGKAEEVWSDYEDEEENE